MANRYLEITYCIFLFICLPFSGKGYDMLIDDQSLQQPRILNPYFTAYADTSRQFTASELYQQQADFVPFSAFHLQQPDQPFWLRVTLKADSSLHRNHVSIHFHNLTYVDLHVFKQDREIIHRQAGAFRKKQFIAQEDNRFNFHIALSPNQTYTLLIRVWHTKKFQPNAIFTIRDQFEYQKNLRIVSSVNYLLLGAITILFCHCLLTWIVSRHIPYLWLFLFLMSIGLHTFTLDPDFSDFFFPQQPETGWLLVLPSLHLGTISFYALILNFLQTKEHTRRPYNVGRLLIALILFLDIFSLLNNGLGSNYYQTNRYNMLMVFIHLAYITWVLATVWKAADSAQRYLVYGILCFGAGTVFMVTAAFVLKEGSYMLIGIGAKVIALLVSTLFLTGFNKQLRQHEHDKLLALQRLNELQQQHTFLVEQKVVERTEQLTAQQQVLLQKNQHIETLIDELNHRVKNNLQMLYSLNTLQLPNVKDRIGKQILNETRARIKSMILVNEHLQTFEKNKQAGLAVFISDIVNHVQQIYDRDKRVTIVNAVQTDIQFDSLIALPFGLILTELFTNVYKHAFPPRFQQQPTIRLAFIEQERQILFLFEDNGMGSKGGENSDSMGLSLIHDLVRQLKGTVDIRQQHGFHYQFTFSKSS